MARAATAGERVTRLEAQRENSEKRLDAVDDRLKTMETKLDDIHAVFLMLTGVKAFVVAIGTLVGLCATSVTAGIAAARFFAGG